MAKRQPPMRCPKCGDEMNLHAEKPVAPATPEEAKEVDPAFGVIVQETHACAECGTVEFRRAP